MKEFDDPLTRDIANLIDREGTLILSFYYFVFLPSSLSICLMAIFVFVLIFVHVLLSYTFFLIFFILFYSFLFVSVFTYLHLFLSIPLFLSLFVSVIFFNCASLSTTYLNHSLAHSLSCCSPAFLFLRIFFTSSSLLNIM